MSEKKTFAISKSVVDHLNAHQIGIKALLNASLDEVKKCATYMYTYKNGERRYYASTKEGTVFYFVCVKNKPYYFLIDRVRLAGGFPLNWLEILFTKVMFPFRCFKEPVDIVENV
jgi:hypothetical protein